MWIIWPFQKKNFGSAWTVSSNFRRFIDADIGKFSIRDEKSLPHPKQTIFESICILLLTETDQNILESMKVCAFELAFFQKDVGEQPLHLHGVDVDTLGTDPIEVGYASRTLTANPAREKYDRFKRLRDADWERMKIAMTKVLKKSGDPAPQVAML